MKTLRMSLLSALALTAAAMEASADERQSPWSLSVFGGDAVGVTGSVRTSELGSIPDLGVLDPALAGSEGSLTLNTIPYDDAYRHRHDIGFELGYAFSPNLEGFGRATYEGQAGQSIGIGSLSSESLAGTEPLIADFDDVDSWSLQFGTRYYWPTSSTWRPFAGIALGATRMDALSASLSVPDTAIELPDVHFTRADTVFTQSVESGVEYAPNRNFGLRFALDLEHMGKLSESDDPALAELGIDTNHDAEDRWSFPITLTASYKFGQPG